MTTVMCPYCGKEAELVTGEVIYPHRQDLYTKRFYLCSPCDAYVGCHEKHKHGRGLGDGTRPLGRLANKELRAWKMRAHAAFDPIWQSRKKTRSEAYLWLRLKLGMDKDACHIGLMDVADCKRVVQLCREFA